MNNNKKMFFQKRKKERKDCGKSYHHRVNDRQVEGNARHSTTQTGWQCHNFDP
jgi:hypothetical protein